MQFVPYRLLRNDATDLRRRLKKNGSLVVTNNGEPFALMLEIQADNVEAALHLAGQLRAQLAISAIRARARAEGLDRLTPAEIENEIREVRHAHRA